MIDRELVTRKLALIASDLAELRTLATTSRDEYLASIRDQLVAERLLERIIGRMIDVNYHVLTESGYAPPRDYHQSFTELGRLGVVDVSFAARIAGCAGLRNRIAHEYNDLDHVRVHEALAAAVVDIPEWGRAVERFVEKPSADG